MIGIHCVFEHHSAMTPVALEAFLYEYRIRFPVAVDRPSTTGNIPHTMEVFSMRGTPTLILLDWQGCIRLNHFGRMDDLRVGATIGQLVSETAIDPNSNQYQEQPATGRAGCDGEECAIAGSMQ